MKTYEETIEKPRLQIKYCDLHDSPREYDTLGLFLTKEGRHSSPDGTDHELYSIMLETEHEASNAEEHIELMKKEAKKAGIKLHAIYPVHRYEHSDISYKLGVTHGFDYSNCGFYFVLNDEFTNRRLKELGIKAKDAEKEIANELDRYSQYVNGEVYSFVLYDEDGEIEDSCGGFYDIEEIRKYLPGEWKYEDLEEYFYHK